eukprot:TRINITY_DN12227_c1_g1_i2.p1 TRINITY_DN12227_c1_g1~~TRINITY_DN12227_c1_g1_i2.p1  ORF type:complete len:142 (+),score=7.45 TRINITY_DN12227_c1_g1_i2:48-428(+)
MATDEKDVAVSWVDQQRINTFGRLNSRMHEIEAEISSREEEQRQLEDAADELELADEDEAVLFLIGESFVEVASEKASSHLEKQKTSLNKELTDLRTELTTIKKTLAELKVLLYDKFGKSINLEEE